MRFLFCFLFSSLFPLLVSQEGPVNSNRQLKAGLTASLNSNGIASIPAFSLGAPAIVVSPGLAIGRFSYDPVLAYGLDVKPWFIDSWLHYMIIDRKSFKLRTGINFSNYFSEVKLPDRTILQGERYWAFEIAGIYNISSNTILTLMYWNDRGQEAGTISGNFIALAADKSEIQISGRIKMAVNLMVFYIGYTGQNDGLFISGKTAFLAGRSPLSLFLQATQVLNSNIDPWPGFKWNVGMAITL